MGGMNLDLENTLKGVNETTGDTLEINFSAKTWRTDSSLHGVCKDKKGKTVFEISGNWADEIFI